jgi:hypothetical protein
LVYYLLLLPELIGELVAVLLHAPAAIAPPIPPVNPPVPPGEIQLEDCAVLLFCEMLEELCLAKAELSATVANVPTIIAVANTTATKAKVVFLVVFDIVGLLIQYRLY